MAGLRFSSRPARGGLDREEERLQEPGDLASFLQQRLVSGVCCPCSEVFRRDPSLPLRGLVQGGRQSWKLLTECDQRCISDACPCSSGARSEAPTSALEKLLRTDAGVRQWRRESSPSEGHRAIQAEEQGTEIKGDMMGEISGWLDCWSRSGMTDEKYAGLCHVVAGSGTIT